MTTSISAHIEQQRAEQGLPARISDPAALRAIASLVQESRTASLRMTSRSKEVADACGTSKT
jgi:hypothetical protein